mmetsp:Transcript_53633/g.142561  ORF Transcript_53633/g.142561 Transcript_53633/m.142561 type:complete len:98 (+) Transcript_53633:769-1062(+)
MEAKWRETVIFSLAVISLRCVATSERCGVFISIGNPLLEPDLAALGLPKGEREHLAVLRLPNEERRGASGESREEVEKAAFFLQPLDAMLADAWQDL